MVNLNRTYLISPVKWLKVNLNSVIKLDPRRQTRQWTHVTIAQDCTIRFKFRLLIVAVEGNRDTANATVVIEE